MSTHTEQPPVQPAHPEVPHDDHTGAFGFFRKYQKLILYTAGIFALITFSITGAMTDFFGQLRQGPMGEPDTIVVAGKTVELKPEDELIGGLLEKHLRVLPGVLPPGVLGDGSGSDTATCLAILRRASIAEGLDISMDEVDRAIAWDTKALNEARKSNDSPSQMALRRGLDSLAQYRQLTGEAMRIGNYVLLQSIGVDVSDAVLMQLLVRDREKLTAKVATFDMKKLEEELKASDPVSEEALRAWLDDKEEAEKSRLAVYDTNKVSLHMGVIRFADYDATEWAKELEDFKLEDARREQLYKQERETRFKSEDEAGVVTYRDMNSDEVKAELETLASVDHVLQGILNAMRTKQNEAVKALNEEYMTAMQDRMQYAQDRDAAKAKAEESPDDEALQTALRDAENIFIAKEAAEQAAKQAVDDARANFDFKAEFEALVKDEGGALRKGVALVDLVGPKNAEALKDLSEVELGSWSNPFLATSQQVKGALGPMPSRADKGAFLFQVSDVVLRPMKPWEDLKESLEEAYYIEKAKAVGDEQKEALEKALLELAKATIPDEVAEIEGKRTAEVERLFGEWETARSEALSKAEEMLGKVPAGTRAHTDWQARRDQLAEELGKKDEQRTKLEEQVGKDTETKIKEAAAKHYAEVIDAAVGQTRFTMEQPMGPYKRDLQRVPFFKNRYDRTVVFLWSGPVNELEVGESTGIIEDTVERRWQLAVISEVAPMTVEDVSRREFVTQRKSFDLSRVSMAQQQSFTLEALKARYQWVRKRGEQIADGAR